MRRIFDEFLVRQQLVLVRQQLVVLREQLVLVRQQFLVLRQLLLTSGRAGEPARERGWAGLGPAATQPGGHTARWPVARWQRPPGRSRAG
ncbi:hypothetical protein [Streptomyces sp. NPDC052015]|uniref:hypothetical protein n=1 Tax=Streptomyces sp. NPDC052015 TaxID=3154755 RepID=UPI0034426CE2